jgi:N-methylhydantoinase A/oxoprolinase/acetone carboxylase beta subunit
MAAPSQSEQLSREKRTPKPVSHVLVGVDTGGTFTDFVCFAGGQLHRHKVLSTPDNPARAVLMGLGEILTAASPVGSSAPSSGPSTKAASGIRAPGVQISYGSTVATNAVLERRGARVVLLTTAGFEDVLEIGRQTRSELYTLEPRKPEPLVPRRRRIGVAERVTFDGKVLRRLTAAAVEQALRRARALGAESVAVCLLHSYANPAHERFLARSLRTAGIPCSISHELLAEYREYERLSTTVLNAYVSPVMSRHLDDLGRGVGTASLRVLQSNGGAVSVATARREAVRTLLSGPAAGVMGAMAAARRLALKRVITFDMGGTSTDVSLVDGGCRQQTEWDMAGLPVQVPAIDIHTVGAGGGSLAVLDPGGALKVGPESAGADPGPACYGRGRLPTVTDADVVLGRLAPDAFLGGRMRLEASRAERALHDLGRGAGLSTVQAAEGVVRVVNAGMERAIRRISVERGHDPRDYTLVSFGGAGGMHACELAGALGMGRVIVPHQPGLLSACGAVSASLQRDLVQTVKLLDPPFADLLQRLRPLVRRARREAEREGGRPRSIRVAGFLDCRYRGQSYEIRVPANPRYRTSFETAHRGLYGYVDETRPVEVVNLRVSAFSAAPRLPRIAIRPRSGLPTPHRLRWNGRWLPAHRWERETLPIGRHLTGPLVITEFSATTFVPPGWTARTVRSGDLVLESEIPIP